MLKSLEGITVPDTEDLTKQDVRKKIWTYLMDNNIVRHNVFNRIPTFEGDGICGNKLSNLEIYSAAQTILVGPDKAQEDVRFLSLIFRKMLLIPSPRLIKGLFNLLENEGNDDAQSLRRKSQAEGIFNHSRPIKLEDQINVDLIVMGSVAVSKTGRRIGKGEGFADLEYAMMKTMKAIDDNVKIITTVHDCQVFDDLPSRLFQDYDIPVDIIITPTQIINVDHSLPRPNGIYWHLLSVDKFKQIPILKKLYDEDKKNNVDVTLLNGCSPPDIEETEDHSDYPRAKEIGRTFSNRRGQGRFSGFRGGGGRGSAANGYSEERAGNHYVAQYSRGYTRDWSSGRSRGGGGGGRGGGGGERRERRDNSFLEKDHEHSQNEYSRQDARDHNMYDHQRGRGMGRRPYNNRREGIHNEERNTNSSSSDYVRGSARGWGRGRGARREMYEERPSTVEDQDPTNIQVTFNVSKQNKIVRREVEATDQMDRVGSADFESNSLPSNDAEASHNKFAIYVGGIPFGCRYIDLKSVLKDRGVFPNFIAWKDNGFAFLNFYESSSDADTVIESLQGLSLKQKPLKIGTASVKDKMHTQSATPRRERDDIPQQSDDIRDKIPYRRNDRNTEEPIQVKKSRNIKPPSLNPPTTRNKAVDETAEVENWRMPEKPVEVNNQEGGWDGVEETVEVNNQEGGWGGVEETVEVSGGKDGWGVIEDTADVGWN